jgi:hypothetical protein
MQLPLNKGTTVATVALCLNAAVMISTLPASAYAQAADGAIGTGTTAINAIKCTPQEVPVFNAYFTPDPNSKFPDDAQCWQSLNQMYSYMFDNCVGGQATISLTDVEAKEINNPPFPPEWTCSSVFTCSCPNN